MINSCKQYTNLINFLICLVFRVQDPDNNVRIAHVKNCTFVFWNRTDLLKGWLMKTNY